MGKLLHGAILLKIFSPFGASSNEVRVKRPCQFLDLGKVILIFTPALVLSWVEEKIACEHFVHHAAERPNVCSLIIALAKDYLWRSILSSLNLSRKMMMVPASIS